jgi:hypothetical protein
MKTCPIEASLQRIDDPSQRGMATTPSAFQFSNLRGMWSKRGGPSPKKFSAPHPKPGHPQHRHKAAEPKVCFARAFPVFLHSGQVMWSLSLCVILTLHGSLNCGDFFRVFLLGQGWRASPLETKACWPCSPASFHSCSFELCSGIRSALGSFELSSYLNGQEKNEKSIFTLLSQIHQNNPLNEPFSISKNIQCNPLTKAFSDTNRSYSIQAKNSLSMSLICCWGREDKRAQARLEGQGS